MQFKLLETPYCLCVLWLVTAAWIIVNWSKRMLHSKHKNVIFMHCLLVQNKPQQWSNSYQRSKESLKYRVVKENGNAAEHISSTHTTADTLTPCRSHISVNVKSGTECLNTFSLPLPTRAVVLVFIFSVTFQCVSWRMTWITGPVVLLLVTLGVSSAKDNG